MFDVYVFGVYVLPTCHVYFAHGHIRVYGYVTDVGLLVDSEIILEDEWMYNVTIASDHPNMIWTRFLIFINIGSSCGDRRSQRMVCEFTI